MTLSQFHPAPRLGHLECMENVLGYLRKYPHGAIRIRTGIPEHEASHPTQNYGWDQTVYSNVKEERPRMLQSQGQARTDDNLRGCKSTVLLCHWSKLHWHHSSHLLNQNPLHWFSK